jgi:hypothetical protein
MRLGKNKCIGNGKVGGNVVNQDFGSEEKNGASMGPIGARFKNGPFRRSAVDNVRVDRCEQRACLRPFNGLHLSYGTRQP